jgi:predicted DNA-binding antitoxin AbrB/MazE fold protein
MPNIIDAIYEHGVFRPKVPVQLSEGQEVLLTVLKREAVASGTESSDAEFTTLASEETLARIWNDPIEDEAWAHL